MSKDKDNEVPTQTPLEDLRAQASKHYEEASSAICHWSSFVENAIKNYNPKPNQGTEPLPPKLEDVIREMKQYENNEAVLYFATKLKSIQDK